MNFYELAHDISNTPGFNDKCLSPSAIRGYHCPAQGVYPLHSIEASRSTSIFIIRSIIPNVVGRMAGLGEVVVTLAMPLAATPHLVELTLHTEKITR